jgi:hypothetical protein
MRPRASNLTTSKVSSNAEYTHRMIRDYSHRLARPIDYVEDTRTILRVGDVTFELLRDTMNSAVNGWSNGPNHLKPRSLRESSFLFCGMQLTTQPGW